MKEIINRSLFLHELYLGNKTVQQINEHFAQLFSELESLLCASLVGIPLSKIDIAKSEICSLLDHVKEQYLLFNISQYSEVR